jgi:hypothetical protein
VSKTLVGLLLCLLLLAVCSAPALAQARHPQAAATSQSFNIVPLMDPDAGFKKIFSNLGTASDAYDASNGYFVSGQNNSLNGQKQDIAIPFKPAVDSTVIGVKLALQYYGYGFNGAAVAIFDDLGGLPGTPLAKAEVKNFLDFGIGCCQLVDWRLRTGLVVKAGIQYWVVGTTNKTSNDSVNTWDFVWNDQAGKFAFQQDNGGWLLLTRADGYAPAAVAVVGTQP